MVTWFIGKSGSGKTTLSQKVYDELKTTCPNLVLLDGDILREVWGDKLGHSVEARLKNSDRLVSLCRMLDKQGIHVICAVLSIFPEAQKKNRNTFSNYCQIYLNVSMETLEERDTKGIYKKAKEGLEKNVVGYDIPFPTPIENDLELDTSNSQTLESDVNQVLNIIREKM